MTAKLSQEESKAVAGEILNQLGGNKFMSMTGAHNLICDGPSLRLKFKGSKEANYLEVTLTPMDTYEMKFMKLHGIKAKEVAEHSNIYNDQLQKIFTKVTGLDTHL